MKPLKIERHCTCGATWKITGTHEYMATIANNLERLHSGPGHAPTDAKTAAHARKQLDQPKKGQ